MDNNVHVLACVRIFHPFKAEYFSILGIYYFLYLFIHQWTLGLLHLWAIANNAAVYTHVQIFLQEPALILNKHPGVELLNPMVCLCFVLFLFFRNYHPVYHSSCHIYNPTNSAEFKLLAFKA